MAGEREAPGFEAHANDAPRDDTRARILAAAMESRYRGHVRLETPYLDVRYTPAAHVPYRPAGPAPSGAALSPWPPVAKT